jgi:hypothetical protein
VIDDKVRGIGQSEEWYITGATPQKLGSRVQ